MANGRNKGTRGDSGRDSGGFIALPWTVLDCPAYRGLSTHAKALLLEVARQFSGADNGRLLLSRAYMVLRGWKSSDMLSKAKAELLAAGFIFETVKGQRPNKASWYAMTWRSLDKLPGYDPGAEQLFQRGASRQTAPIKNAVLGPPHGTARPSIVPPHGTDEHRPVPPHGPMAAVFGTLSVPPHGHPLEKPSAAAVLACISHKRRHGRLACGHGGLFTGLLVNVSAVKEC